MVSDRWVAATFGGYGPEEQRRNGSRWIRTPERGIVKHSLGRLDYSGPGSAAASAPAM